MDYIKVNGHQVPYPNGFKMTRVPNIVAEITTLTGQKIADYNGWKYDQATLSWDYLKEEELQTLLSQTDAANGSFLLTFFDTEDGEKTINAWRISRVTTKTRFKEKGHIVWTGIELTLDFPDCYR